MEDEFRPFAFEAMGIPQGQKGYLGEDISHSMVKARVFKM
jgi:hypothetical protein